MNYQELVDKCKKAYADKDLKMAYKYWEDIFNITDDNLNKIDKNDEIENYKIWHEHFKIMEQFTNDEVFDICDYGKRQAYREMEKERTYNILDKSIQCVDLFKSNKKMKYLDEFLEFYEWCIIKSDDEKKYNIYDLQTNEIIDSDENNGNKTLNEAILRIVDRALDYELDEHSECLDDEEYEKLLNSRYIKGLISIQDDFIERRTKELEKELEYEEKKLEYCGYSKEDLYYIENLKNEIEILGDR